MNHLRPAAVEGTFYPASPDQLRADLADFLEHAAASTEPSTTAPPKALIAPHAGYLYSGAIAASAFATLKALKGRVTRVIHLGPSHFVPIDGLAASSATAFQTPLGDVPIDADALATALTLPQVAICDEAHAGEHCLEVHLPFLQAILGESFSLLPLVVGNVEPDRVREVIDLLWGGEETLIVVSSDLSHYHDYETARVMDKGTAEAIAALAPEEIGPEQACGRLPIQGLLLAARERGLEVRLLDLRNSGDTAGSRDRVVGYGAWIIQ